VEAIVASFESAWWRGKRPAIDDYLPAGEPLRSLALLELAHAELECRLKAGEPARAQDYLMRYPELGGNAEAVLGLLESEYRLRRRDEPDLTLADYAQRFPELAEQIRRRLSEADAAGPGQTTLVPAETGTGAGGARPEGPRYRALHFHARGGLGEVWAARDQEFGRRVALKRLRQERADDPESRRRFLWEAEVTARLEHPGIVPAYGLTWDEAGRPCYAMRFIQGESLQDAIRSFHQADGPGRDPGERSLALRQLLGRFVDVCQTVAYVHSRGVLHRDLKPANVMLGKYGETLVIDWGLARHFDRDEAQRSSGEESVAPKSAREEGGTRIGEAVGTPAYMSPEQAEGRWDLIGPATDVYGLGATLYALLTGEAPFAGKDGQALLERVKRGEIVPPRQRKRQVPRALEAICLKAMAAQPESRYTTALELAADVEHWLADEPVLAHREPWVARVRRWRRRRRMAVAVLATALLAAVLIGGGAWLWLSLERAERVRAAEHALDRAWQLCREDRRAEAREETRRAEALLGEGGGDDPLRQRARGLLADLDMVQRLEKVRLHWAQANGLVFDRGPADREYTAAFKQYGIDVDALGAPETAARVRGRPIRAQLVAALDDWAWVRRARWGGWRWWFSRWKRPAEVARLADPDRWRNRLRDALVEFDRKSLRTLARSAETSKLSAEALYLLGISLTAVGDYATAVQLLRQAQQRYPTDFWINHQLAYYLYMSKPPEWAEAVRYYTAALALRPESAAAQNNLGIALVRQGRLDEAIAALRKAIRLQPDFHTAHANLGSAFLLRGQPDKAIAAFRKSLRLDRQFAGAHAGLGAALLARGQLDQALAALRQAIHLQPDCPQAHTVLGMTLHKQGKLDEAITAYRRAIHLDRDDAQAHMGLGAALGDKGWVLLGLAECQKALSLNKDSPQFQAQFQAVLGQMLLQTGQLPQATAAFRKAIHLHDKYAQPHMGLGTALLLQGKLDEASAAFQKALGLDPHLLPAYVNLGHILHMQGKDEEAIAKLRQAIDLNKNYALAYWNLGLGLQSSGRFAEALAAFRQADQLGSRQPGWSYPSGQQVRECKRLVALEKNQAAILKGEVQAGTAAERLALAQFCGCKKHYGSAARWFEEAFRAQPRLLEDVRMQYGYCAACAAALAGCGRGADAALLDSQKRARWRDQAFQWLRSSLTAWANHVDRGGSRARLEALNYLGHWQKDPHMACVREAAALAKLPEAEQKGWRQLWADVQALLTQASGQK
jgi:serine/threonine-protein kinase